MKIPARPEHIIRLNREFRSDLQWWSCFLPIWNGRSILPQPRPAHWLCSDASGSWGCGALNDSGDWFQVKWPTSWTLHHIAAKEMVPVVIALAVWGAHWKSSGVLVMSDNMAVVGALSSGAARDPPRIHLLRCLHFSVLISSYLLWHGMCLEERILQRMPSHGASLTYSYPVPHRRQTRHPTFQPLCWKCCYTFCQTWTSPSWRSLFRCSLETHLAPSTLRVYKAGQRRIPGVLLAVQHALVPSIGACPLLVCCASGQGRAIPPDGEVISVSYTLRLYIGRAIGDPFARNAFPMLQYVLRGIKRIPAHASRQPRLPITPAILRLLKSDWNQKAISDSVYHMLRGLRAVFYFLFSFLRAGEFTVPHTHDFHQSSARSYSDISVDSHLNPTMVRVLLRQSKNLFRRGVAIYLGRTGKDLCPVTAAASAGIEDSIVKMLGRWESSADQRYLQTPRDSLAAISAIG